MDTPAELKNRITHLQSLAWKNQDREQIATLFIKLSQEPNIELSPEETSTAAKYCHTATYAAIHGTNNLEDLFLYSKYARTFNNQLPNPDHILTLSTYIAEAIALRKLDKPWLSKLKSALRERHKAHQANYEKKAIHDKEVLILWGLAIHFEKKGRHKRAINLVKLSIQLMNRMRSNSRQKNSIPKTKKQIKAEKILAILLISSGAIDDGINTFNNAQQNEPDPQFCRDIATALLHANQKKDFTLAEPYLKKAADHYTELYTKKNIVDLKAFYLLLEKHASEDNLPQCEYYYNAIQQEIKKQQQKFLFPDNLDGFLGSFESIYAIMLALYSSRNMAHKAMKIAHDSFWNTSLPIATANDRQSAVEKSVLLGKKTDSTTSELDFALAPQELHIIFYSTEKNLYRITRSNLEPYNIASFSLPKHTLEKECAGIRSAATAAHSLKNLFSIAKKQFSEKIFASLQKKLNNTNKIYISANFPLNFVPWNELLPKKIICFKHGITYNPQKQQKQNNIKMLSTTENGTTLKMAPQEKEILKNLFPDSTHITPDNSNKELILYTLQNCDMFHFAGHGYSHNQLPEKSGLLLYGTPPIHDEKSIIRLNEIESLDLSGLKLAFLNSCSSGYGRSFSGGLYSHAASSFLKAGTQNLIVSLNPIFDKASAEFTQQLYTTIIQSSHIPIAEAFHITCKKEQARGKHIPYLFIQG